MRATLALILFVFAAVGALSVYQDLAPAPYNLLSPISVEDPVGAATPYKLQRLRHDAPACFATLDSAGVAYTRLEQSPPGRKCGFYDALTLDRSAVPYSASLQMTCPLTAALAVWERQVLLPAAERHLGAPVSRIETYGSYSCRRKYNRMSGDFSEHATANAIDISGFRLADGRVVSLSRDWDKGTPEAAFLADLRAGACKIFSVVLSPDYNAAHKDHFHLDMSKGGACG